MCKQIDSHSNFHGNQSTYVKTQIKYRYELITWISEMSLTRVDYTQIGTTTNNRCLRIIRDVDEKRSNKKGSEKETAATNKVLQIL